ncbi:hypothetical protein [Streptomyces sp. NPDC039028]|uniref:hypothetical protein n=1 Tax=unclassified Streptomyces TaxID=2593676 RepID=UPI0033F568F4
MTAAPTRQRRRPRRVALARLIVKQPSLVLADEPTGALDEDDSALVVDILRATSDEGCAVVIATPVDATAPGAAWRTSRHSTAFAASAALSP